MMSSSTTTSNNTNTHHQKNDSSSLRIVSWNVAGWTATSAIIRAMYDNKISSFLNNFSPSSQRPVDIFALQEVKGTMKKLKQDPVAAGASDGTKSGLVIPGWDTFWAHSDVQFKGFNGVAIFARSGLVLGADPAPLRVPELDAEGRCIVAVTEGCCVFSVYAPSSSKKGRTELRLRFFKALADAVERVRKEYGRPVVLCGDLNATYRACDCHWTWRRFSFEKLKRDDLNWPRWLHQDARRRLIEDVGEYVEQKEKERKKLEQERKEKEQQQQQQPSIASLAGTKKNPSGENSYPRQKPLEVLSSSSNNNNNENENEIDEGDENDRNEFAVTQSTTAEDTTDEDATATQGVAVDPDEYWWIDSMCTSDSTSWKSKRWYPISQLAYSSDPELRSMIKNTHVDGRTHLGDEGLFGIGLVDSLVKVHPDEKINKGLFTCWNQSRNERYSGVGQRIDYVLTDPEILVCPGNETAAAADDVGNAQTSNNAISSDESSSSSFPEDEFHSNETGTTWKRQMSAATSNNLFKPAPIDGGGMTKLSKEECEKSLCSILPEPKIENTRIINSSSFQSQAGVIYTAPQLSDHVAVFCDVLNVRKTPNNKRGEDVCETEILANIARLQDKPTKACKYTSATRSIAAWFTKAPSNNQQQTTKAVSSSSSSVLPQRRERETKSTVATATKNNNNNNITKSEPEVIELD